MILFPGKEGRFPLYFYGKVPRGLLEALAPAGQYIFVLEALAQCLALWIFWPCLRGPYWSFVDNAAAQWALAKGYCSSMEANVLTTLFWSAAVRHNCDPWFERVPSKANCSDAISRTDTAYAVANGWVHCDVDLDVVWKRLLEALDMDWSTLPDVAMKLCTVTSFRERTGLP